MRNKAGVKFDCIYEETLDYIDIDYTHLNKTVRYEERPHGEWEGKPERRKMVTRICTSCGERSAVGYFCMWCGAECGTSPRGDEKVDQ